MVRDLVRARWISKIYDFRESGYGKVDTQKEGFVRICLG